MTPVLVLGAGDVGSAVAHVLFSAGHGVILHDRAHPPHARRTMAFTDAFYGQVPELDGLLARRAPDLPDLPHMLRCRRAVPTTSVEPARVIDALRPRVIVDARMRKRQAAEDLRANGRIVVGLGPGFDTRHNADIVVETRWGQDMGRVIREGAAAPLEGEPRELAGHRRERFVYSPAAGVFGTALDIGARVAACALIGRVGSMDIRAPLGGTLRGLSHDGAFVEVGSKIVEVAADSALPVPRGLGPRPQAIARGVLAAVDSPR